MSILNPLVIAQLSDIPGRDSILTAPPVWWHSYAGDINADSFSTIEDGRYIEATGDIEGLAQPTLQDTYKSGTGSRSGHAMGVVAGTWQDDVVSPWSDKYYLGQLDSSTTYWEVADTAPAVRMKNNLVVIHLGIPDSGTTRSAANTYAALELAYGQSPNYRLRFAWHSPIMLDYTNNALGGVWQNGVAVAHELGTLETYLRDNDNQIVLQIRPDYSRGVLLVEIGNGHFLRNTIQRGNDPSQPASVGALPANERYRFYGARRAAGLEIHPLRFSPPTIKRGKRYFGNDRLVNVQNGFARVNVTGASDSAQTLTTTPFVDGTGNLSYSTTIDNADNTVPQRASDVLIVIPPVWGYLVPPLPITFGIAPSVQMREIEVWDDATRMGTWSARILCNNRTSTFAGQFHNYGVDVGVGNGVVYAKRARGIIGRDPDGIKLSRQDPFRFAELPCRDSFAKMDVPLNQEVTLDGLCIYTAIRLLAQMGNIHPGYLLNIPDTGFPPYGTQFPYYILGSGMGANPKYRYLPDATVLSVLQDLIQDSGEVDPYTGISTPHYMWFDPNGQFYFQPYDPRRTFPVAFYSSFGTGMNSIYELHVYNSVEQMRTEVILQGQDAFTYELMQIALPLPGNLGAVGFRFAAFERNAAFATPAYLQRVAITAAIQASLPTQVIRMRVPYNPLVHAGNTIIVAEDRTLARGGVYTVLEINSTVGIAHPQGYDGTNIVESWITARSVESSIPY